MCKASPVGDAQYEGKGDGGRTWYYPVKLVNHPGKKATFACTLAGTALTYDGMRWDVVPASPSSETMKPTVCRTPLQRQGWIKVTDSGTCPRTA